MTLSSFVTADQIPRVTSRLQEAYELDIEIAKLQEQISDLQDRKALIIEEHINAGIVNEGPFTIVRGVKNVERLDPDAFRKKYPKEFEALFNEIGVKKFKPSKSDAARVLTSFQVEKVCKTSETVSYSVTWDMRGEL